MDFYLTSPSPTDGKLIADRPSAHLFVFQILDLAVALILDREDHNRVATDLDDQNEKSGYKASKEIALIVEAIFKASVDSTDWLSGIVSSLFSLQHDFTGVLSSDADKTGIHATEPCAVPSRGSHKIFVRFFCGAGDHKVDH